MIFRGLFFLAEHIDSKVKKSTHKKSQWYFQYFHVLMQSAEWLVHRLDIKTMLKCVVAVIGNKIRCMRLWSTISELVNKYNQNGQILIIFYMCWFFWLLSRCVRRNKKIREKSNVFQSIPNSVFNTFEQVFATLDAYMTHSWRHRNWKNRHLKKTCSRFFWVLSRCFRRKKKSAKNQMCSKASLTMFLTCLSTFLRL